MNALARIKADYKRHAIPLPGVSIVQVRSDDLYKLLALADASQELYRNTADYITRNNLGDVHHNRDMQMVRDALAALTEDTP